MEISPPVRGILKGLPPDKPQKTYSEYMNNCRPQDVLEKRIRIGQRPGLDKWGNGTQIGSAEQPVVAICTVSSVV
jgi:hypothetical protein